MGAISSLMRARVLLLAGAALALAGCAEPERILVGEREDIRPVEDAAPGVPVNQSRAISLPAMQANANWSQSIGTPSQRVAHPALRVPVQQLWSVGIGSGDGRRQRITAGPVVGGGLIYTLDSAERVSAVTPTGQVVWSKDLIDPPDQEGQATGGGLAYADGALYVSSGFGRLTAMDARTGEVRWAQRLNATGSGVPTVHDGLIYLVAGDDTAWAIRTDNGRIAWRFKSAESVANVLGAPAPAVSGQFAVFGFGSGDVVGVFRQGGVRRWAGSVAGQRLGYTAARYGDVTGSPLIVGNTVYVGNHSGRIAAFRLDDGERLWTLREGAVTPMFPAGDSLFAISDRNQLLRIDAASGELIWAVDLPGFVKDTPKKRGKIYAHYGPVLAGGRIVVASNDGKIRFFAPQDGTQVAAVEIKGGATSAPAVAGKTLYVVTTGGELVAFR